MKRLLVALFTLAALAVADAQNLRPITDSIGRLPISIDPRIELLGTAQLLTNCPYCTTKKTQYSKRVKSYFGSYVGSNAVERTKKLFEFGFGFDAPAALMLCYSYPPELARQRPHSDYLIQRAGRDENLQMYRKALSKFARTSRFAGFWMENEVYYRQVVAEFKREIGNVDVVRQLEDYYRMRGDRYHVILCPLFGGCNYGPAVENADGTKDMYAFLGMYRERDGVAILDRNSALTFLLHEFSHSFVNPTTAKYSDKVMQYSTLYEPLREQMCEQAYANWMTCLNEHIVRAVVIRILEKMNLLEFAADQLETELKKQFVYVPALLEKLKEYEALRDVGKVTFEEYMPTLLEAFEGAELSRP